MTLPLRSQPNLPRPFVLACVAVLAGAPACSADHATEGADAGGAGATAGTSGEGNGGVPGNGGETGSGGAGGAGRGGGGARAAGGASGSGGASSGGATASGGQSSGGRSNAGGGAGTGGSGGGAAGGGGGSGNGGAGGNLAGGCAGKHYILCEDFEATKVGDTPSGWTKHGDASGVADDAAKHGSHSLKLGAIPVWERRIYHSAAGVGSAHWGRVFYKVQLPVPDAFVHSTMVAFSGNGPVNGPSEFRVVDTVKQAIDTRDVGSRHQFLYNVQPQSHDEFGKGTSYDYTFDADWHCAEWHIDAATQSYHFYFEGVEKLGFDNGAGKYDGSDLPMSFGEIKIGWINYQDSPPGFVAWLDDIAVADTRIGCD